MVPGSESFALPGDGQDAHVCTGEEDGFLLQRRSYLLEEVDKLLAGGIGWEDLFTYPRSAAEMIQVLGKSDDRNAMPGKNACRL